MNKESVRLARICAKLALLALVAGCTMIQQMTPSHRKAEERAQAMRTLQLRVMRYADEYAGRVGEAITNYQRNVERPEDRLAGQNWKLSQSEAVYTIASGPDPLTNALDMVVLATLSRMVIGDLWMKTPAREQARVVLETHQLLEAQAWRLVEGQLTESQTTQLRDVMVKWRKANPDVRWVAYIHFLDFAKSIGSPAPGEEQAPGSLFSILGLDPFTRLDPAVREVTQTRQLAERTIFYFQRAPRLLDMQVERMSYQLASMPEAKLLLKDLDRAALVGSASDQLVKELPDLLARERKAILSQLASELDQRSASASALAGELRSTLQAGTETANALHAALDSVDRITARFAKAAPSEPGRPFDVREYTETLRELTAATRELDALAQRVDSNLPQINRIAQDTTARVQSVVDRAYRRLLTLIVVAIIGTLLAALTYRVVAPRIGRKV